MISILRASWPGLDEQQNAVSLRPSGNLEQIISRHCLTCQNASWSKAFQLRSLRLRNVHMHVAIFL